MSKRATRKVRHRDDVKSLEAQFVPLDRAARAVRRARFLGTLTPGQVLALEAAERRQQQQ